MQRSSLNITMHKLNKFKTAYPTLESQETRNVFSKTLKVVLSRTPFLQNVLS